MLLQAIARVNRLFEGKDFGYIIDYYGILGDLDKALTTYSSLADFDEEDLAGALANVNEEVKQLPERHSHVWDIFKVIRNRQDEEAYEQLLADEEIREQFYTRLSIFARTLKIALSTLIFAQSTTDEQIDKYKNDSKFFLKLRVSVQKRYSDSIDYKQYETQIQKLIDTHITSDEVIKITEQVNIFAREEFKEEVERVVGKAAKADLIASRTSKTITEKMEDDPAFYRKFSQMLEEVIEEYRQKRLSDAEYLQKVTKIMESVQNRTGDDLPEKLQHKEVAKAFYGISLEILKNYNDEHFNAKDIAADTGIKIDEIVKNNLVVDWHNKEDIQNRMRMEIDDYLFSIKGRYDIKLSLSEIDQVIEKSIEVAKHRY